LSGFYSMAPPLNSFFAPEFLVSRLFQVQYWAPSGRTYILQASTHLVNWVSVNTNTPAPAPFSRVDPWAKNAPFRIDQVVTP